MADLIIKPTSGTGNKLILQNQAGNAILTTGNSATDTILAPVAGHSLQVVNYQTGAVATGTTTIPVDDTIPQKTEGDEYLSLAITPDNSSNLLKIEVSLVASCSSQAYLVTALFQDAVANALAVDMWLAPASDPTLMAFNYYMTAGTTSATTFKVRVGGHTGTTTINGWGGNRKYGGVMSSSITISEISA